MMKDRVWKLCGKVLSLFKSLKFAALIISLLILVYFLGLIIPQKMLFESRSEYLEWIGASRINMLFDYYGLTDIYLSPLTIVLLALFFITLLVITVRRIPSILTRAYLKGDIPLFDVSSLKKQPDVMIIPLELEREPVFKRLQEFFKKKRWYVAEGQQGKTFTAVRNRFSPLGFLFFHFSFVLCLLGGLMIMYTRFNGNIGLTEGQAFYGEMEQFFRITSMPKILRDIPAFSLFVRKIKPRYENNVPVELTIDALMKYREVETAEKLRINEPIKKGPLSIIAKNIGVSPLFIVRDRSGREIDGAYISLNVLYGNDDSFQFDLGRPYRFETYFFPDYAIDNGREVTKTIELRNPAFHLLIKRDLVKTVYEGTILRGEQAEFDNYTIAFEDIRYWVNFIVIREYGKATLISGFIFAAAGLIMRLVFYQKSVRCAIEYDGKKYVLYMHGRCEYFRYTFRQEMERLTEGLKVFLSGG